MNRRHAGIVGIVVVAAALALYASGGLGGGGTGGVMGGGAIGGVIPRGALPTVTGVTPNIGSTQGHTWVLVTGTDFMTPHATAVKFDGVNVPCFMVVGDTQILCYTPAHAAGSVQVTVTNSNGTSTNNIQYQYTGTGGSVDFSAPDILSSSSAPDDIARGDYHLRDHKMDLVTVDSYNNIINLYKNNSTSGDIVFLTPVTLTPANHPVSVACADMNGDGWDDVVTANVPGDNGEISVYVNNTNGTFAAPVTKIVTTWTPEEIALGDFNNDGWCDIAVAVFGNTVTTIFENDTQTAGGAFQFLSGPPYNIPNATFFQTSVATTDFDKDNFNDLTMTELYQANGGGNFMFTHENTSSGGAIAFAAREEWNVSVGPTDVVYLDADNDNWMDTATADSFNNSCSVFENTSVVDNISFAARVGLDIGFGPFFIAAADFSGDGWADLVCTDDRTNLVDQQGLSFFKNKATGAVNTAYPFRLPWPLQTGPNQYINVIGDLEAEDYDLDGKTDLAMIVDFSQIYVVRNISTPIDILQDIGNGLAVKEQGPTNDTYTLVLTSKPGADVVITVDPDIDTNLGAGAGTPIQLTFTKTNYATPQTVTVTAVDDADIEGPHTGLITHSVASLDPDYNNFAIDNVAVQITDNDAVVLSDTQLAVIEGNPGMGVGDSYTIVLGTAPTDTVTVDLVLSNGESTVDLDPVVFTTGNWSTPQTVNVSAVGDTVPEGPHSTVISHAVTSNDTNFNNIPVEDTLVAITDNDIGIVLTETLGNTAVTEGSSTPDTYTVHLATNPGASITVTVTPDSQVTVNGSSSPIQLNFNAGNWFTPQQISVLAVNDLVYEGNHTGTINHAVTGGGYGATPVDLIVDITDNEAPPPPTLTLPVNGLKTYDATPTVVGTASPNLLIKIYRTADPVNPIATTNSNGTGNFNIQLPTPLIEGVHTLYATATYNTLESDPSNQPTITVDLTPPASPTNVQTELAVGYIKVTWTPPVDSDLYGFRIYRKEGVGSYVLLADPMDPQKTVIQAGTNEFYDSNVTQGIQYTYKVVAIDDSVAGD